MLKSFSMEFRESENKGNSINMNLGLQAIAILNMFYSFGAVIFSLLLYIMEGRFSDYIPTVSETGTEYPNYCTFAHTNSTAGLATFFSMLVITIFIRLTRLGEDIGMTKYRIIMVMTLIGQLSVCMFPLNETRYMHYISASTGFLAMLIFDLFAFKDSIKQSKLMRAIRMCIIIISAVSLIIFLVADIIFVDRINVSVSTVGEYVLFAMIHFYLVSYTFDVATVKVKLFLL